MAGPWGRWQRLARGCGRVCSELGGPGLVVPVFRGRFLLPSPSSLPFLPVPSAVMAAHSPLTKTQVLVLPPVRG